jgi:hypothetical protein
MYTFIMERASDSNIDDKMRTGFNNFENCLNAYLDQLSDISSVNDSKVTIYGSVTLENGAIMRATNSYHKRPWFSDVSVRMNFEELLDYSSDQGICYGQVIILFLFYFFVKMLNIQNVTFYNNYLNFIKILLIAQIDIKEQEITSNLALIRWYDFKSQNQPYLYGCSRLKLTNIYNFIDIEAVQDIIHIIPRFNLDNEYFVNKFIF